MKLKGSSTSKAAATSRGATVSVALTPGQLQAVKARVRSGKYRSPSELVRDSLQKFLGGQPEQFSVVERAALVEAYRATADRDLVIADEWAHLDDAWPEK